MHNDSEKESFRLRGKLTATNWLSDLTFGGETEIVQVVFKNTRSAFFRNTDRLPLKIGDWVAVEAAPGVDIGKVCMVGPLVRLQMKKQGLNEGSEIKRILRIASDSDMEKFRQARQREEETMIRSRQIAAELDLNMKIGDVEYQGDGAKAIFYYIADERVDFRKLIRILADTFKIRIEMKQIGARQEAGRIGGIGPCGRPLCCSSWMQRFVSVGTGAARIQDISMNPQKLAGQCGKLKCCLNFETDAYAEASAQLPGRDVVLQTKDQDFYWFKVDILARKITYSSDKKIAANLATIDAARAFEIIALNKQGIKPDTLAIEEEAVVEVKEYVELVGQDSLTRFDKSKRRKGRNKKEKSQPEAKQKTEQKPKEQKPKPQSQSQQKPQQKPRNEKPQNERPQGEKPQGERRSGGNRQRQHQRRKPHTPQNSEKE